MISKGKVQKFGIIIIIKKKKLGKKMMKSVF